MASSSAWMRSIESASEGAARPPYLSNVKSGRDLPSRTESFLPSGSPSRGIVAHRHAQPGLGVGPVVVGRRGGNAQHLGRLLVRQASEVAELDQLRFPLVLRLELCQGLIERK